MSSNPRATTVGWWLGWITLTIVSFFISCAGWTWAIARHYGTMDRPGAPLVWVAAVFGTWMVILLPLIVVMYRKVDQAYEDARIAREKAKESKVLLASGVRFASVERALRTLPRDVTLKLKRVPWTLHNGHLVHLRLRDGSWMRNVFVLNRREIAGLYGSQARPFDASSAVDVQAADPSELPEAGGQGWLRLEAPEDAES